MGSVWLTWWLGDLAGALLVTPVIVLWAAADLRRVSWPQAVRIDRHLLRRLRHRPDRFQSDLRIDGAPRCRSGSSPCCRSCGPRSVAARATPRLSTLVLAGFAVWGTFAGSGPFGRDTLNESFLLLLTFMIGVTVPSLALSADASVRRRTEDELRAVHDDLNRRVASRTADLTGANLALQEEIDRRQRAETVLDRADAGIWSKRSASPTSEAGCATSRPTRSCGPTSSTRFSACSAARKIPAVSTAICNGSIRTIASGCASRCRPRSRPARVSAASGGSCVPNGEIRHVQTCVELMKNDAGRVVGMHGICFDVTERKQAEIALERTREQLCADAEDGGARPADRRHRARLQQPPDDRERARRTAAAQADRSESVAGDRGDHGRRPSRRAADPPAPDVLAAPAAQSGADRSARSGCRRCARCSTARCAATSRSPSICPTICGRSRPMSPNSSWRWSTSRSMRATRCRTAAPSRSRRATCPRAGAAPDSRRSITS